MYSLPTFFFSLLFLVLVSKKDAQRKWLGRVLGRGSAFWRFKLDLIPLKVRNPSKSRIFNPEY